ncbi:unnamed protein product [Ilex paraguariensis]|uniref:Protein kinase domain-containing protein n=1 Tax=Ilex paraguariensis TaxID=185542 RepID=A0ABC8SK26_9AQUA
MEYASGGSLADELKNSGEHRLSESDIRRYTKSSPRGLHYIHMNGIDEVDLDEGESLEDDDVANCLWMPKKVGIFNLMMDLRDDIEASTNDNWYLMNHLA